jgi:hypothetical protein
MAICNLIHECKQETHGVTWISYLQVFGEEPTREQSKTWGETRNPLELSPSPLPSIGGALVD